MTWTDPIVEEVRRVREEYAARFNHDLQAIFRDLKEQEKRSGRKVVAITRPNDAVAPPVVALSPVQPTRQG